MREVKLVKPEVWNFKVVGGEDAWKEVVYSARLSGVPPQVKDEKVFKMLVANDYGSALEHVTIKFDVKMSKGNAPEFLEHRMMSHSGYSTRYIEVSEGIEKKEKTYEVILPTHLLTQKEIREVMESSLHDSIKNYAQMISKETPREISRYVLPFAQAVGVYHVTINLRSLLNLLSLRLCVRSSPEFRCIASQLYAKLVEELPLLEGLIGCRGFMRGACPESGVTGVRVGKQHPFYPVCPYRNLESDAYIPTIEELRGGVEVKGFNREKAQMMREKIYGSWASWE
ncbi:MAG: FAD-dependent thymidylate synthase [Candidatus Altiarchaeota archaeon]|nr:FAD-dependent thymidylate synthase [Candidatus Altiarchaeota archaeon]